MYSLLKMAASHVSLPGKTVTTISSSVQKKKPAYLLYIVGSVPIQLAKKTALDDVKVVHNRGTGGTGGLASGRSAISVARHRTASGMCLDGWHSQWQGWWDPADGKTSG